MHITFLFFSDDWGGGINGTRACVFGRGGFRVSYNLHKPYVTSVYICQQVKNTVTGFLFDIYLYVLSVVIESAHLPQWDVGLVQCSDPLPVPCQREPCGSTRSGHQAGRPSWERHRTDTKQRWKMSSFNFQLTESILQTTSNKFPQYQILL